VTAGVTRQRLRSQKREMSERAAAPAGTAAAERRRSGSDGVGDSGDTSNDSDSGSGAGNLALIPPVEIRASSMGVWRKRERRRGEKRGAEFFVGRDGLFQFSIF
jgi:hypothetical protein